jgi:hypothetical protein
VTGAGTNADAPDDEVAAEGVREGRTPREGDQQAAAAQAARADLPLYIRVFSD